MGRDTKDALGGCLLLVVLIAAMLLAGWGMGWFSLWTARPMAKYAEQTRKEVYDTSRQYQQGTNRDIARYCEQMRGSETTAGRKAVAALIRSTASTYDGELTEDNVQCVAEADKEGMK